VRETISQKLLCGAAAIALLFGADLPACAQRARTVSAADVAFQIRTLGAKSALAKLYETEAWSASIAPGIASGSLAWIHIAEELKTVADGAAAEDLDSALIDSLARAPLRVLPELSRIYGQSIEEVCDLSFEDELPKPDLATYVHGIRAKLAVAKTVRSKSLAVACNRGLDRTLRRAAEQGLR
jgi:hypothetical protein